MTHWIQLDTPSELPDARRAGNFGTRRAQKVGACSSAVVSERSTHNDATGMTSQRMRVDIYGAPLLVAAVALWQVGTHVDAWYHFHRGFEIESFVTWPHAMLYAGWFASLALAAGRVFAYMGGRNQRHAWPPGGRLMLLGTAL